MHRSPRQPLSPTTRPAFPRSGQGASGAETCDYFGSPEGAHFHFKEELLKTGDNQHHM